MRDLPEPTTETPADDPALPAIDGATPDHYDPADYRWVPVRRRPRYDGWTEEKQRRFIETLADTGIVALAAQSVGMTRETAYRLRRSPHGAAFARAWDAARDHAGSFLEDLAFERAIEGIEHNVYDDYGEVVCTRRAYDTRLLTFLLAHLKPERYGRGALAAAAPAAPPPAALEASLRAMEPRLPAPAEAVLGEGALADELALADAADGTLPQFLNEQRPIITPARRRAAERAAQDARGAAARAKRDRGEPLTAAEFADACHHIDPTMRDERRRGRFR